MGTEINKSVRPRRARSTAGAAAIMLGLMLHASGGGAVAQSEAGIAPADRFVQSLDSFDAIPADARDLMRTSWSDCDDCDGEEFLIQALTLLSPAFRDGLDAYEDDDYETCIRNMGKLAGDATQTPFVRLSAAAYEIKALVQRQRLAEAHDRVKALLEDSATELEQYTYFAPEMQFVLGYVLVSDLQYVEAAEALEAFLSRYPDASQRLVVPAQQMLKEIKNQQPGNIGEVVDLMNFCGRRLDATDTGQKVLERQARIVELLDELIEQAEQQESSSSSSGGGGGGSDGKGGPSPANPMQQSTLPGGAGTTGDGTGNNKRANPAEAWGSMPPAEREKILQALRDSFPSRYRRLVEQYYADLAKEP